MEYLDYYKILGVSRKATQEEIRRAFRKHARKYHPDVNKSADADARFKNINEAYEVLKDPEKRKHYDTYGSKSQEAAGRRSGPFWNQHYSQNNPTSGRTRTFKFDSNGAFGEATGFSDFFNDLFGNGHERRQTGSFGYNSYDRQGRSQEAEITVTLDDVINGATKSIALQTYQATNTGRTGPNTKTLQVKIPKGVTDGSVIRLAGQGEPGYASGPDGDLLIRIHIAPDRRFSIEGHNLHTVVNISPWEAALGAKIPVQTASTTVSVTIPRGTQGGKKMRLRGKGLTRSKGSAGDLIVEIQIMVPSRLTREERDLFEELQKTSQFDPRKKSGQRAAEKAY